MQHDKYAVYMILLVAIVGVVAMAGLIKVGMTDLTGQAVEEIWFQPQQNCTETDGGDNPYTKGYHTGTYPWGGNTNNVPDACRDASNQKVSSCAGSGCKLMEYYCRQDGYLFWNFYNDVNCTNGAII